MKIPINARVNCRDEFCGHTTCAILDPRSERVTHVVVRERSLAGLEHLVADNRIITFHREQVPAGELAIHSGAAVYALDGKVGQVDEFIFEAADAEHERLKQWM